jgi:cytosine/adenosine deaminase-related metal-dependent hydrolase
VGNSGAGHVLWRDAVLVYEGSEILFVGEDFTGEVDQVIDAREKLVIPGFIETHVHSGHRASHRMITDVGRPDYFGQPFFEISVPKAGTIVGGDPRYARPGDRAASEGLALNDQFTVAELLRNDVTTFVEFGSQLKVQEALDEQIGEFGIRAYLGPGFDSGRWVGGPDGKLTRVVDEADGVREFELALDYIERRAGAYDGRLRGILVPREVETCTLDLLRTTAREAATRRLTVAIHAAYNILEFFDVIREHQMTSIELLERLGLMSDTLNIGHGNFVAENPLMNYSGGRDLEIMGAHRCTISHCPVNVARRARFLDSCERYRKAGVNIALGTDTYPRDMIMQMRTASYVGKIASRNLKAASAAKADIVIIDLTGRDTLRMGPVRDPIKSLVECGIGDDVDTVIVDGVVRVEGGRIPGVDFASLRGQAQEAGERIWSSWEGWAPLGRSADQMCPFAFPRAN